MKKAILIGLGLLAAGFASAQLTGTDTDGYQIFSGGKAAKQSGSYYDFESYGGGASYASFAYLDDSFAKSTATAKTINLSFTEADDAYSLACTVAFYLTTNTTAAASSLAYNYTSSAPTAAQDYGIDSNLYSNGATAYLLGTGAFVDSSTTGYVDSYSFGLSGAEQTYVDQQLASGGDLRIVTVVDETGLAGADAEVTEAGVTATSGSPLVTITTQAVPEPISMTLLGIGALGLLGRRRK